MLALVAAGVGPALVPATAARIAPPGITFTALHDPEATWDVGIAWHPVQHTARVDNFVESVLALGADDPI
ncbi:LysR substrate-binding domain-containing protein [Saccharopolyspora shandongensis]|uniref:LysR substrate-binding domain-containing protein n=1 Tax=Saccharopolyspora shandongensis TaxID=418495 RepID=UPI003416CCEA